MIKYLLTFLIIAAGVLHAEPNLGTVSFTLEGRELIMQGAQCGILKKKGKHRLIIGGKDRDAKIQFALTLDLPADEEITELTADTRSNDLTFTLKSAFGHLAVMPAIQFARAGSMEYVQKVEVDTGVLEDDPNQQYDRDAIQSGRHQKRRKIRKIKSEYKKVKPDYINLSREERIRTGKGIIENKKFKDTYFMVHLKPVKNAEGKITEFIGSFSGSARMARYQERGKNGLVENGKFRVKVTHVK